jgi:hypothetical protein
MIKSVPNIVDSVQVFGEKLKKRVGGGIVCLYDLMTRLTVDVIIKVTL